MTASLKNLRAMWPSFSDLRRSLRRRCYRYSRGFFFSKRIDFLIIGSAKCGTTSLHKYLAQHPDIYLPSGVGINDETGLFLPNSDQRIKALTNRRIRSDMNDTDLLSAILEKYGGERVIGEEATDYTKRPFRTVRFDLIKTHNPKMKFVFIVRDPIQKLFSQYRHFRRHQPQHTLINLREEISSYTYYKYASAFCFQLQPYVTNFGKDAIHVLLLEELMTQPQKELNRIFEFLGVTSYALSQAALVKHNVNNEISKSNCSVDNIPQEVLEFILDDAHRLSRFLGRDLGLFWPSISSRRYSDFGSSLRDPDRRSSG